MVLEIKSQLASLLSSLTLAKERKKALDESTSFNLIVNKDSDVAQETNALKGASTITVEHLLPLPYENSDAPHGHIQYGYNILERLEDLRQQILKGQISFDMLRDLRSTMDDALPATTDSRLRNILEDIRTRAEVELAKLEKH